MTTQRGGRGGAPDPMQAGTQMWQAGYQSLMEGWRQAQEFWNSAARGWGEMAGTWMGQMPRAVGGDEGATRDSMAVMRELQEAAFGVAQAWMRLPLIFVGGARPEELQDAVVRLTEAQGRAYQLWMEAINRAGGAVAGATAQAARTTERVADQTAGQAEQAADRAERERRR